MNGHLLAGRYQIERTIGEGGMGTVYLGTDTQTQTPIAIKSLKSSILGENPELLERFAREASILRELNHPNIVKALDTCTDGDQHYIIMEYVVGGDLREWIEREGSLPIDRAILIALDLADALTRAHRLKVVHRDLKPANVLIAEDGTPRLTDFGVAHIHTKERMTDDGIIVGTPDYLAPEVIDGKPADSRADIWAFGIILYEMVGGQRPFHGDTLSQTLYAIMTQAPEDLEELRSDCPTALVDLIYRMLEKDPNQRIPSVRQVGAILETLSENIEMQPITRTDAPAQSMSSVSRFETTPDVQQIHHNLPIEVTPFVGRQRELDALNRLLTEPSNRLVTILGSGGMGKTRLALELAKRQMSFFSDGVYLVALAPLKSADAILNAIADALDFRFYAGGTPQGQLLDYLRNKQMLIVMDNFEHVIDGVSIVAEMLGSAPNLKVIATSRTKLNLQGETTFSMEGMEIPDSADSDDVLSYSAIQFFAQSAKRAYASFELDDSAIPVVIQICKLVFGMPLGIELAAAWVSMLNLDEIVAEISANLDFLETEMSDVPTRHRSIRAVFDYSWQLMSAEEQTVFQRLAVFRGGFSRNAAQAVAGASLKQLMSLANKSLIYRDPTSGDYSVHELLRQYAEEILDQGGEAQAIHQAHSTYYLQTLKSLLPDICGKKQLETLQNIDDDFENLRSAWEWAASHRLYDLIIGATQTTWLYFWMRGNITLGDSFFVGIYERIENQPEHPQKDLALFHILARRCSYQFSLQSRQVKQLWTMIQNLNLNSAETQPWMHYIEGNLEEIFGDKIDRHKARELFLLALDRFREVGDLWMVAHVLRTLGNQYWHLLNKPRMNLPEAKKYLLEAMAIQRSLGDIYGQGHTLMNIGTILSMLEEDDWLDYYQQSIELRKQISNHLGLVGLYYNLGLEHQVRLKLETASDYLQQALLLAKQQGFFSWIFNTLGAINENLWHLGKYVEAKANALELQKLIEGTEWQAYRESETYYELGLFDWALGNYEQARDNFRESLKDTDGNNVGGVYIANANNEWAMGHYEEASRNYEEALKESKTDDQLGRQLNILRILGHLYEDQGDLDKARDYYEKSCVIYDNPKRYSSLDAFDRNVVEIYHRLTLARLASLDGRTDDVKRNYEIALSIFSTDVERLNSLRHVVDFLVEQGDYERAVEIATLMLEDPRTVASIKDRMKKHLEAVRNQLSDDAFAQAEMRGKQTTLDGVRDALLALWRDSGAS